MISGYQVRDKRETDNVPERYIVAISDLTGVLTNDDGVNFTHRILT